MAMAKRLHAYMVMALGRFSKLRQSARYPYLQSLTGMEELLQFI